MPTSLVVGGGLIGLSTAYFLQQAGDRVIVVDCEEQVCSGASHANGSYVCPSQVAPWAGPGALGGLAWLALRSAALGGGGGDEAARLQRIGERVSLLADGSTPHRWLWRWRFVRAALAGQANYDARTRALYGLACKSRDLLLMMAERHHFSERVGLKRGSLVVYSTEAAFAAARQQADWMRRLVGADIEVLADRFAVRAYEPSFSFFDNDNDQKEQSCTLPLAGALYSRDDWIGDARLFCLELEQQLRAGSAGFRLATRLAGVEPDDGDSERVGHVVTASAKHSGERIAVDRVFICAGVHTPHIVGELFPRCRQPILIQPVKGHSITVVSDSLKPPPGWPQLATGFVHGETHSYVSRLDPLRYRLTNGVDAVGFDTALDPDKIAWLQQLARSVGFPERLVAAATPWAGLRPATPTGIPYIGRLPGYQNVYINAGHGSLGWTLAAASARLCLDIADDNPTPIVDPTPFQVQSPFH